jgi:hypothetical protein
MNVYSFLHFIERKNQGSSILEIERVAAELFISMDLRTHFLTQATGPAKMFLKLYIVPKLYLKSKVSGKLK